MFITKAKAKEQTRAALFDQYMDIQIALENYVEEIRPTVSGQKALSHLPAYLKSVDGDMSAARADCNKYHTWNCFFAEDEDSDAEGDGMEDDDWAEDAIKIEWNEAWADWAKGEGR